MTVWSCKYHSVVTQSAEPEARDKCCTDFGLNDFWGERFFGSEKAQPILTHVWEVRIMTTATTLPYVHL